MKQVVVLIPAWDEEQAIARVIEGLSQAESTEAVLRRIVVVDNNSSDRTAEVAHAAGAEVYFEPLRGYGSACLRGMRELGDAEIVLFIDADGSDLPTEWPLLVDPVARGEADFVVGSRVLGRAQKGALLPHQKFGNVLATFLLASLYKTRFTDLGPFRAVRRETLEAFQMEDQDFGWTVEMQIKALRLGVRACEAPVTYRPRYAGRSKIAGSLRGSFFAGRKILGLVLAEMLHIGVFLSFRRLISGGVRPVKRVRAAL